MADDLLVNKLVQFRIGEGITALPAQHKLALIALDHNGVPLALRTDGERTPDHASTDLDMVFLLNDEGSASST